jgi:AcrR family transcriptional regulator
MKNQKIVLESPSVRKLTAGERRNQLLQIAKELFSESGFRSTTTKAIAAAAGVTEGIIFKHFSSKKDLYASLLDNKAKEIGIESWRDELDALARREDDKSLTCSVVKHILELDREDPQFQKLTLQAALSGEPLHEITAQRLLPLHDFLCKYIKKRQKKGAFQKCDPKLAAYFVVSVPSYFGLARILFGVDDFQFPEEQMTLSLAQLIVDGLHGQSNAPGNKKYKRLAAKQKKQ